MSRSGYVPSWACPEVTMSRNGRVPKRPAPYVSGRYRDRVHRVHNKTCGSTQRMAYISPEPQTNGTAAWHKLLLNVLDLTICAICLLCLNSSGCL